LPPQLTLAQHRRILPTHALLIDADDFGEFAPVGLDVIVGMEGCEIIVREVGSFAEIGVAEAPGLKVRTQAVRGEPFILRSIEGRDHDASRFEAGSQFLKPSVLHVFGDVCEHGNHNDLIELFGGWHGQGRVVRTGEKIAGFLQVLQIPLDGGVIDIASLEHTTRSQQWGEVAGIPRLPDTIALFAHFAKFLF